MKYLTMHKVDAAMEAEAPMDPALGEKMGALIKDLAAQGKFLGGEGLGPSRTRTRLTFKNGETKIEHGPYAGRNELVSGMCMLKVRTRDEAIAWARRFADVMGDSEVELGPLTEPWDMGFGEKPTDAPLRVLCLQKATAQTEKGPQKPSDAMTALLTDMQRAGVLVTAHRLQPSSQGHRLFFKQGKHTVVDGPFAESKELIAGYALLDLSGRDELIAFSKRFADVLGGTIELDALPLRE